MSSKTRPSTRTLLLPAVFVALLSISCGSPVVWNADVESFVDDGTSIVTSRASPCKAAVLPTTVAPSGGQTVVTLNMTNPRSLQLTCSASCSDGALLSTPPKSP